MRHKDHSVENIHVETADRYQTDNHPFPSWRPVQWVLRVIIAVPVDEVALLILRGLPGFLVAADIFQSFRINLGGVLFCDRSVHMPKRILGASSKGKAGVCWVLNVRHGQDNAKGESWRNGNVLGIQSPASNLNIMKKSPERMAIEIVNREMSQGGEKIKKKKIEKKLYYYI